MSDTQTPPKTWRLIDPDGDQILVSIDDTDIGQSGCFGVQVWFHGDEYEGGSKDFEFDLSAAGKAAARVFFEQITDERWREIRDEWRERKQAEADWRDQEHEARRRDAEGAQ
jgi:hypothetical protein